MEITALGHAGLRVSGSATTGLVDPWFTTAGAFLGSWHQLPANDHLATADVLAPSWVAISQRRADHLDLATLAHVPVGTPVFVPAYPSKELVHELTLHTSLHVIEVDAWARVRLDGTGNWLTYIPEDSPVHHRAALLLSIDGESLLAVNDSRLTVGQTRRANDLVGGQIDAMTVQPWSASSHPICYEYTDDLMAAHSARRRHARLAAVLELVRSTDPSSVVTLPGPPCFLDPKLAHHNRWLAPPGIFPDQEQSAQWPARLPDHRVLALLPGDRHFPHEALTIEDGRWEVFSFSRLAPYLRDYAHSRAVSLSRVHTTYLYPDDSFGERFSAHFARLGELNQYFLRQIEMTVQFEVTGPGGGSWDVHIGPERVRVDLQGRARERQYRFRLRSRWLAPVVDGRLGWEDLFLSFRFSAWRDPDVDNDNFFALLRQADRMALQTVEEYDASAQDVHAWPWARSDRGDFDARRDSRLADPEAPRAFAASGVN